ncbi:MAG: nuclear transport factor 2 family protein [Sphingomonas sp.]
MADDRTALATLLDKEAIRELGQLYSRAIDRKDVALLRSLYADDATDTHGDSYDGDAAGYCDFIARSLPYMRYSGHHVCNHLVAVDGDAAEGEIYAIATHVIPDGAGGWIEDIIWARYIDRYARVDGRWRFAKRVVTYDHRSRRPADASDGAIGDGGDDPSYGALRQRLFARGAA